jgi:hypothetical protein
MPANLLIQPTVGRGRIVRKTLVILVCLLIASSPLLLYGFALYGPRSIVWKYVPLGRYCRYGEVDADNSLVGMTKSQMLSVLGSPDRTEGPFSRWWPRYQERDKDHSALMFTYDDFLNVINVSLFENESTVTQPLPLNVDTYRNESPEVRHRMHLGLVELSKQGRLPNQLRTAHDVERVFPNADFVDTWFYEVRMLGYIVVTFDSQGKAEKPYVDW